MFCKNCNKEISDDSLFCEFCGAKIQKSEIEITTYKSCRYCKQQVSKDVLKCPNCGEWLEKSIKINWMKVSYSIIFLLSIIIVSIILLYAGWAFKLLGGNLFILAIQSFILSLLVLWIYFIPTFIAEYKKIPESTEIFIINLTLGWTLVGWSIALTWSVSKIRN